MKKERYSDDIAETVKNAASGYGVVVLAVMCFMLTLVAVAFVVRVIVGGGIGVGA